MKWYSEPRRTKFKSYPTKWKKWLAWHPVPLGEGDLGMWSQRPAKIWFKIIERRMDCKYYSGGHTIKWWDYREIK